VNGLHHVIVGWDTYDERVLRDWLQAVSMPPRRHQPAPPPWRRGVRELPPLIAA
jgi:hypothetical protein